MGRIHVNLRRLPRWLVMSVAVAIVVAISLLAWQVGKDEPNPEWVTDKLNPFLGWLWLVLAVIALLYKLINWTRNKKKQG